MGDDEKRSKKQREDRRLNVFWRRNKCFPAQFGGYDETPNSRETLDFWRSVKNKAVSDGLKDYESIRGVFNEVREKIQGQR